MAITTFAGATAVVALFAGGLGAGPAPAPGVAGAIDLAPVPAAYGTPLDYDHGHDWNGDRRGNRGWDGHVWRWWHDVGIRPQLCRDGGGHVQWWRHRCEGGRFDDFRVR